MRFDRDDSVVSRAELGRVQRERDNCQRERTKLDQQLRFAKEDYKSSGKSLRRLNVSVVQLGHPLVGGCHQSVILSSLSKKR